MPGRGVILGLGRLVFLGEGGGPTGEQSEVVGRGAGGFGAVGDDRQAGVGGQFHRVEVEGEFADDGVLGVFDAGAVQADVVGGPAGAEQFAAGGQLPDQILEGFVVGSRPASERSMATTSEAMGSQSR